MTASRRSDPMALALFGRSARRHRACSHASLPLRHQREDISLRQPFKTGQRVQLSRTVRNRNVAPGSYEVVRQLPTGDDGERQYRLKSASESHERVAKESELEGL